MRKGEHAPVATKRGHLDLIRQEDFSDCGAACLCMVLRYFGKHSTLGEVRRKLSPAPTGSDAQSIVDVASEYGLRGTGFFVPPEQVPSLQAGWILHLRPRHFVVFGGRRARGIRILDPARGIKIVERSRFGELFSGIALCFERNDQ